MLPRLSRPGPAERAEEHYRDSQSAGEGIALGEIRDGAAAVFGSAGQLREGGPAVDEDTLFEIGSITKIFTGILLADAVLKKKAALVDPISKHLPSDLFAPDSPLHGVTLLDLATHHSGLPRLPEDLSEGASPSDPYAHYSVERLHSYLRRFEESNFEKRGEMSYSNLGIGLLGYLLERIGEKPYGALVRETIFEPLEMSSSFVQRTANSIPAGVVDRFATGHSGGRAVPHWHLDALCGAGAAVSTARDLARFAEAHWSGRTPPSLLAAMEMAATPQRGDVGLAWFIGKQGLFHDGGTGGFRSELRISPETESAFIRLVNSAGPSKSKSEGDFSTIRGYWSGYLGGTEGLFVVLEIDSLDGKGNAGSTVPTKHQNLSRWIRSPLTGSNSSSRSIPFQRPFPPSWRTMPLVHGNRGPSLFP